MGSKLGGDDDDVMADINITPFVDIILVVLIIFMVTATTIVNQSIQVQLPESATAEPTDKEDSVGVMLTAEGGLLVDKEPSTPEALQTRLRSSKAAGKDVVVLVSADKAVAHGRLVWLLDLVQNEGIGKFAINVDKAQALPPDPATVGQGRGVMPGER